MRGCGVSGMMGSGRWWGWLGSGLGLGWLGLRSGFGGLRGLVCEPPFSAEDTNTERSEELKETTSQIETTEGASRTFISDGSGCLFVTDFHDNSLEAVRSRIATTILSGVQCDDMFTRRVKFSARAGSSSYVVEGPTSATETLVKLYGTLSTLGDVTMASTVRMAEIAEGGQGSCESKKSETKTHG